MEDLQKELHFALRCTILLDIAIWLLSLIVTKKLEISVPLGLLLGSVGMYSNLLLLRRSILNAVYHGKTRDIVGYLIRVLIASAVIASGLMSEYVNAVTAVLPFLYPKVIFGILATKPEKAKSDKNGGM